MLGYRLHGAQAATGRHLSDLGAEAFERTVGDGIASERCDQHVPLRGVLVVFKPEILLDAPKRFIQNGFERRVEKSELFKVGQNGERDHRAPRVALGLVDALAVSVDVDRRSLGFDNETCEAVHAEDVVWLARAQALIVHRIHRRMDKYFQVLGGPLRPVLNIPAEKFPEAVDVVEANLRLLILGALDLLDVSGEPLNQVVDVGLFLGHIRCVE